MSPRLSHADVAHGRRGHSELRCDLRVLPPAPPLRSDFADAFSREPGFPLARAVRLAPFLQHVRRVVRRSPDEQVRGFDTRGCVATVTHDFALPKRAPVGALPHDPAHHVRLPAQRDSAVPRVPTVPGPEKAVASPLAVRSQQRLDVRSARLGDTPTHRTVDDSAFALARAKTLSPRWFHVERSLTVFAGVEHGRYTKAKHLHEQQRAPG